MSNEPEPAVPVRTGTAGPFLITVLGCALVGSSSTFIRLSEQGPTTAAFYRCFLALIPLAVCAAIEFRRLGRNPAGATRWALLSGVFLGADYLLWTQSILDTGAAVATVLIGSQVIVYPVLTRFIDGERLRPRFAIALPLMLMGLALTGGVGTAEVDAANPVRGTIFGIASGALYAGYLYFNRRATALDRRRAFAPVAFGTASSAVVIAAFGLVTGSIAVEMPTASWGWLTLVAVGGQFLSFVFIGIGTVRLPSDFAATVLLLQPVTGVIMGQLVLGERLGPLQYTGIALTVLTVGLMSLRSRRSNRLRAR